MVGSDHDLILTETVGDPAALASHIPLNLNGRIAKVGAQHVSPTASKAVEPRCIAALHSIL